MRTTSKAMAFITIQCHAKRLDPVPLLARTKALLGLYRHAVWSTSNRAENMRCEIIGTYGMQLNTALLYLSDLAPQSTRSHFEASVSSLFESKWLIQLTDMALQYVRGYPESGQIYANLLRLKFMDEVSRTDQEVMEQLGLERSAYYEKKKEATLLFGVSLFGIIIPESLAAYRKLSYMGIDEQEFFRTVSGSLPHRFPA